MDEPIQAAVENCISQLCAEFKKKPDRWKNEREATYELYILLCDNLDREVMRDYFKWEYLVGPPSYAKGNHSAAVDLALVDGDNRWIGVEIEFNNSIGKQLAGEIERCVKRLETTPKAKELHFGYVVPLLHLKRPDARARGYEISKRELMWRSLEQETSEKVRMIKEGIKIE